MKDVWKVIKREDADDYMVIPKEEEPYPGWEKAGKEDTREECMKWVRAQSEQDDGTKDKAKTKTKDS